MPISKEKCVCVCVCVFYRFTTGIQPLGLSQMLHFRIILLNANHETYEAMLSASLATPCPALHLTRLCIVINNVFDGLQSRTQYPSHFHGNVEGPHQEKNWKKSTLSHQVVSHSVSFYPELQTKGLKRDKLMEMRAGGKSITKTHVFLHHVFVILLENEWNLYVILCQLKRFWVLNRARACKLQLKHVSSTVGSEE